jgi:alkylation response protein AidB-like acyl-CoA dehydrogenase
VDFSLTEEPRGYQKLVREFAEQEVAPRVQEYDREERYPVETIRKMAPLGFLGAGRFPGPTRRLSNTRWGDSCATRSSCR